MPVDAAPPFTLRHTDWTRSGESLRAVRRAVFIVEQGIDESLEWDDLDPVCPHVLAVDAYGIPVGCGRLLPDGYIGRLAVLAPWRGRGVGGALLRDLMTLAKAHGHAKVLLNSQTQAMSFYTAHGFAAVGDEFMEAGIPHRTMCRLLA